jgi:hypothetical protein
MGIRAKLFLSGPSVSLSPVDAPWQLMREALDEFEPGFELQREQPAQQPQDRHPLHVFEFQRVPDLRWDNGIG